MEREELILKITANTPQIDSFLSVVSSMDGVEVISRQPAPKIEGVPIQAGAEPVAVAPLTPEQARWKEELESTEARVERVLDLASQGLNIKSFIRFNQALNKTSKLYEDIKFDEEFVMRTLDLFRRTILAYEVNHPIDNPPYRNPDSRSSRDFRYAKRPNRTINIRLLRAIFDHYGFENEKGIGLSRKEISEKEDYDASNDISSGLVDIRNDFFPTPWLPVKIQPY
ncbi:MAG TPA: hypothetical protein VG965_03025 [Patescibacteria group bacterium]|nr:hypothetical protein [Patescibacteria group bacterium]